MGLVQLQSLDGRSKVLNSQPMELFTMEHNGNDARSIDAKRVSSRTGIGLKTEDFDGSALDLNTWPVAMLILQAVYQVEHV